jgi:hypothetical protein
LFSEPLRQIFRGDRDGPLDGFLPELLAVINGGRSQQHSETQEVSQIEVPSVLFRVRDVMARPSAAPNESGIYSWWFDDLPGVPLDKSAEQMGFKLAYVGIASHKPASRRTLRHRLRNHCRGPIATSTLRRSLAAVLSEYLDLHPYREGKKVRLPAQEEERLSTWLEDHGRVAWLASSMPWVWEQRLLKSGLAPPLNIQGNGHEFAKELSALRRQL